LGDHGDGGDGGPERERELHPDAANFGHTRQEDKTALLLSMVQNVINQMKKRCPASNHGAHDRSSCRAFVVASMWDHFQHSRMDEARGNIFERHHRGSFAHADELFL